MALLLKKSRLNMGSSQSPVQWVSTGSFILGGGLKRPRREPDDFI